MFSKNIKPIFFMILCTFLITIAQMLWKYSVSYKNNNTSLFFLFFFVSGLFLYGIGALFMIVSFKLGELSVLHPLFSLSYVWVAIASPLIFPSEAMSLYKWLGIVLITVGVIFITSGGKK
ncbi:MAG: EamA family transporter [Candidatus Woesearchaeota archaeon]